MFNMAFQKRWFNILLLILITIEIWYISSIPSPSMASTGISIIPVFYHFIVFFLFSFFLHISLNQKKKITPTILILTIFICIIYAIIDEVHQIITPGRHCGIIDILTNSAGIFLGSIFAIIINKKQKTIS